MSGLRLRVDIDRLMAELGELAAHSDAPAPAVTRVVYSGADRAARELVKKLFREAELLVREDALGNTFVLGRPEAGTGCGRDRVTRGRDPLLRPVRRHNRRAGRHRGTSCTPERGVPADTTDRDCLVHERRAHKIWHRLPGQPRDVRQPFGRRAGLAQRSRRQHARGPAHRGRVSRRAFGSAPWARTPSPRSSSCTSSKDLCSSTPARRSES